MASLEESTDFVKECTQSLRTTKQTSSITVSIPSHVDSGTILKLIADVIEFDATATIGFDVVSTYTTMKEGGFECITFEEYPPEFNENNEEIGRLKRARRLVFASPNRSSCRCKAR